MNTKTLDMIDKLLGFILLAICSNTFNVFFKYLRRTMLFLSQQVGKESQIWIMYCHGNCMNTINTKNTVVGYMSAK